MKNVQKYSGEFNDNLALLKHELNNVNSKIEDTERKLTKVLELLNVNTIVLEKNNVAINYFKESNNNMNLNQSELKVELKRLDEVPKILIKHENQIKEMNNLLTSFIKQHEIISKELISNVKNQEKENMKVILTNQQNLIKSESSLVNSFSQLSNSIDARISALENNMEIEIKKIFHNSETNLIQMKENISSLIIDISNSKKENLIFQQNLINDFKDLTKEIEKNNKSLYLHEDHIIKLTEIFNDKINNTKEIVKFEKIIVELEKIFNRLNKLEKDKDNEMFELKNNYNIQRIQNTTFLPEINSNYGQGLISSSSNKIKSKNQSLNNNNIRNFNEEDDFKNKFNSLNEKFYQLNQNIKEIEIKLISEIGQTNELIEKSDVKYKNEIEDLSKKIENWKSFILSQLDEKKGTSKLTNLTDSINLTNNNSTKSKNINSTNITDQIDNLYRRFNEDIKTNNNDIISLVNINFENVKKDFELDLINMKNNLNLEIQSNVEIFNSKIKEIKEERNIKEGYVRKIVLEILENKS